MQVELAIAVNEALKNETSTFDAFAQLGPDGFMSNRAWALATRIADDKTRQTVMDALEVIIDNPFERRDRIERGEPTEVRWADRWHASTSALIVIGERLRAPAEWG